MSLFLFKSRAQPPGSSRGRFPTLLSRFAFCSASATVAAADWLAGICQCERCARRNIQSQQAGLERASRGGGGGKSGRQAGTWRAETAEREGGGGGSATPQGALWGGRGGGGRFACTGTPAAAAKPSAARIASEGN